MRSWRLPFALLTGVAAACAPILGLDDLEPRPTQAQNDSGSEAGPDAEQDAGSCVTHAECIAAALENPARCVKNRCVAVKKDLCNQQVIPDPALLKREDTVLVAAFMNGTNPQGTGAGRALTLALEEIEAAGGILGKTQRHLAVLICDADRANAEAAVKHVVEELQLPAIIGGFGNVSLAQVVADDTVKARVFTINPSFTTDFLKYSATDGFVWGLLGTGEDVALAYRPVLEELKQEKSLGEMKVALVATNGSLDEKMADVLQLGPLIRTGAGGNDPTKALDINGKTPEQDPVHFRRFRIDSLELKSLAEVQTGIVPVRDELVAFGPDVIIALTGPELDLFLTDVDGRLLQNNADGGGDAAGPKKGPYWILGPSNGELVRGAGTKSALGSYVDPDAGGVDSRRARMIGVQFAGALETKERDLFRERMNAKNLDASTLGLAHENFYDAVYWLAYGIAAAGVNPEINGDAFKLGVTKLFKGTPDIHPGEPGKVVHAYENINVLKKDGTRYVGALGPPDINESTGTWNSVGATYCYPPWQEQRPAPLYDVQRYLPDGGLAPTDPGKPFLFCTSPN